MSGYHPESDPSNPDKPGADETERKRPNVQGSCSHSKS